MSRTFLCPSLISANIVTNSFKRQTRAIKSSYAHLNTHSQNVYCIHTDFLYLFLSFPPTQAGSPKTQLSVSEAGRIPHVCVQKQHRCSQGHRGRNMPAGLWTWSWEESCVPPFLSNKLKLLCLRASALKLVLRKPIHWLAPSIATFQSAIFMTGPLSNRLFSSCSLPDVVVKSFFLVKRFPFVA